MSEADRDENEEGISWEEVERMKKSILDEEEKADAEEQTHNENETEKEKQKERANDDRIEFAEITCAGCTYKETRPLDPPMYYTEFEQWKSNFNCPDCGSTCEITEKEYKPRGLSKMVLEINFREFRDTAYYLINIKPIKYILAVKGLNHLVEAQIAVHVNDNVITYSVNYNKIFLTCIPTKISRHKNPITILKSVQKYSMSFIDQNDERLTFKHMTLSGILSELKNLGYVIGDGADHALGSMIRAHIDNKTILDNEDTSYIGFLTDDEHKRIIPSNIKIVDPDLAKLNDALSFLDELTPYYKGRLDLLAELIVWGAFAPLNFMLKSENYFLKWLHLHGSATSYDNVLDAFRLSLQMFKLKEKERDISYALVD